MPGPLLKTVKHLFAASGNCCAHPGCTQEMVTMNGVVIGEICHITAASSNGPRFDPAISENERDSFHNLILLCPTHHKLVDSDTNRYTVETLRDIKTVAAKKGSKEVTPSDTRNAELLLAQHIEIYVGKGSAINIKKAETIHAKNVKVAGKSKVVQAAHPDSIAADLEMSGYVKYLVGRYQKFQQGDTAKEGRGKYVLIYNSIKTEFGRSWSDMNAEQFPMLVDLLHRRIRNSKLGRILGSQGNKLYSSFSEWKMKAERE